MLRTTVLLWFLQIYITNHLNLTLNYTVRVANIDYLIFYIEMFSRNPLKSQDFIILKIFDIHFHSL